MTTRRPRRGNRSVGPVRGLAGDHVLGLPHAQHAAGHLVGPVGRAALAAHVPGLHVDVLERLEADIGGHVDRLGDGAVHPFLRRRLHLHVIASGSSVCALTKWSGRSASPEFLAPDLHGVVHHLLLGARAVLLEHLAGVGIGEDRLDPGTHVAGIEADRAGGRDRGQQRVADAVGRSPRAGLVHLGHGARGEERLAPRRAGRRPSRAPDRPGQ